VRAGYITGGLGGRKGVFAFPPHFSVPTLLAGDTLAAKERCRMADVVNLNRWRKAKARDEKSKQAEVNRVAHGRTKAEKQAARQEEQRRQAELDGHKLED